MKFKFLFVFGLGFSLVTAQTNTEIFLFDVEEKSNTIELKNGKNISTNPGYDNQPSFINKNTIVYAATRDEQTDILAYNIHEQSKVWMSNTPGGEYSPLLVPKSTKISAVRLDKDGKQRLYTYNAKTGESTELIKDLKVAYYTWYDYDNVVSAVIEGEQLNLYVTELKRRKNRQYARNVGRSFHKIPGTILVSFIDKRNKDQWEIKSIDPITGETKLIAYTIKGAEDICWLNSTTILTGKDGILFKLSLNRDNNWKKITDLATLGIENITRLAANASGTKLLVTADVDSTSEDFKKPEDLALEAINKETARIHEANTKKHSELVQKQIDAYNRMNVDAFLAYFTKDVKLYNYPNQLLSEGKTQMRKDYSTYFRRTKDLKATSKRRIVIENKVIDEQEILANGKIFNTVVIYEIENDRIAKVTFLE